MKKLVFALTIGLFLGTAQAQELPQPSPHSKLVQTVGLTEVTLDYSRPGVKDRVIFGELVPFDKVWRFGANGNTLITFSSDVTIGGEVLKAGTYSIFAKPTKEVWYISFNTDLESGAADFDEAKNALMTKAMPKASEFHESFTLEISTITNNSASIVMVWEKTRIEIPFTVATEKNAEKNIEEAIAKGKDLDKVYYNAAKYFNSTKDLKKAQDYLEKSIALKQSHTSLFLKAQMQAEAGNKADAIKTATAAYDLAIKAESKGWATYIEETMNSWKK